MNAPLPSTLYDFWEIALRRKWLILWTVLLSLAVAGTLCMLMPRSYRSTTLILVEGQKIPEAYVKAVVGGSVEERLGTIQQQVMSRTLLSGVIEEFKLYQSDIPRDGLEEVISKMRKDIRVETKGVRSVDAFSISFAHEEPMIAMKVTAKLAAQFIDQNLKVREQLVAGAANFLDQELNKAKAALEDQERAISTFKTKFMGELPQQMEANLRALDRLQIDLNTVSEALMALTERLGALNKAIVDYEATASTNPALGIAHDGGNPNHELPPLLARLNELERNLATLSAEFKDTYPDVIQTKQEIEQLKARLVERYKNKIEKSVKKEDGRLKAFDPYMLDLVKQRDEVKVGLVSAQQRQRWLMAQAKEYEGRVENAPAREQELMILLRDYENMQRNYQSLLEKRLNARVAENLEKRQKGEQFRIIDPANLPEKPEKPDRLRIMLVGLALGCGLGFGAVFAREHLIPVFHRPEDAEILLGLPLLAAIPAFEVAYGLWVQSLSLAPRVPSQEGRGKGEEAIQRRRRNLPFSRVKLLNRNSGFANVRTSAAHFSPELNLVSRWGSASVVAEQYRVAATRLALMSAERKSTVVVVTSAVKGEGKSATALNLGYVLASDLGKSVLLIDCDLKRPVVHTYAGIPSEPGLVDLLHGNRSGGNLLQRLGELSLWILPAGRTARKSVCLSKMHDLASLLNEFRASYEYIILDAPPILPLADMNVLARMADFLALVVRAGTTSRDVVQKALNSLRPTIQSGIILTNLGIGSTPYYMQEGYYAQSSLANHEAMS